MDEQGEYVLAAEQYYSILNYENSRDRYCDMGLKLFESGDGEKAYLVLKEDAAYPSTREALYLIGLDASGREAYVLSICCFSEVGAYKDAAMLLSRDTYLWGEQLLEQGEYDDSNAVFASMGGFSNTAERTNEAAYAAAGAAMNDGRYDEAARRYKALGKYSDSADKEKEARYCGARKLMEDGNYQDAKKRFGELKEYTDSRDMAKECAYLYAKELYITRKYGSALNAFTVEKLDGYKGSTVVMNDCRYMLGKAEIANGAYESAIILFSAAGDHRDSLLQIRVCNEAIGEKLASEGKYEEAYERCIDAEKPDKAAEMAYLTAMEKVTACEYLTAVEWYEKAGEYGDARERILSIVDYYYKTQQYDAAEVVYVKLLGTGNSAQCLYELGQYYEMVGNIEHAAKCYREAGDYQDAPDKAVALQNEVDYQAAEALFLAEDWEDARELYAKIPGYKDVDSKITACNNAIAAAAARERYTQVGNIVTYGHYEQDNNTSNGKEAIEWIVLKYDSHKWKVSADQPLRP